MTKEQEEAIEKLQYIDRYYDYNNHYSRYELDCIETVLNMLKEKDREINRKNLTIKALQCALNERTEERDKKDSIISKQSKQIDLMAEKIFQEGIVWDDKEEVKQYFKRKAEKE